MRRPPIEIPPMTQDLHPQSPALAQWQHALAEKPALAAADETVRAALAATRPHGQFTDWLAAVHALPHDPAATIELNTAAVRASSITAPSPEAGLRTLMPWRKGPFDLYGVHIDSEWRSDNKFARLLAAGVDFTGKHILDVGCGNGYFLYRMLGAGARFALGLDPSWHYFAQYLALEKLLGPQHCAYLPLTLDDIAPRDFDLTLSMGVLYHRREPLQHLAQLRDTLRPDGRLILETLVVDGDATTVLMPPERYAGMRNVWFLPSMAALTRWLHRLGLDLEYSGTPVPTSSAEQRKTTWSTDCSLADFMQPDFSATIEGLPPPQRVILIARKKR